MSLADDIAQASGFNPAEFYRPTVAKVDRTLCTKCCNHPRAYGQSLCKSCNAARAKEYWHRRKIPGMVRKYTKKKGSDNDI